MTTSLAAYLKTLEVFDLTKLDEIYTIFARDFDYNGMPGEFPGHLSRKDIRILTAVAKLFYLRYCSEHDFGVLFMATWSEELAYLASQELCRATYWEVRSLKTSECKRLQTAYHMPFLVSNQEAPVSAANVLGDPRVSNVTTTNIWNIPYAANSVYFYVCDVKTSEPAFQSQLRRLYHIVNGKAIDWRMTEEGSPQRNNDKARVVDAEMVEAGKILKVGRSGLKVGKSGGSAKVDTTLKPTEAGKPHSKRFTVFLHDERATNIVVMEYRGIELTEAEEVYRSRIVDALTRAVLQAPTFTLKLVHVRDPRKVMPPVMYI